MFPQSHECAHAPCTCQIPLDHSYCCDDCSVAAARDAAATDCGCEHAGCGEPALPDEDAPVVVPA
jgi:hypothetical protein